MLLAPTPPLTGRLISLASGRRGSRQTMRQMRALIEEGKHDLEMLQRAVSAIYLTPARDGQAECTALLNLVRDRIRYVGDINGIETLAAPATTWARRVGDCDDFTTLLATLLECVGYPTRLVCAAYSTPREMEHVYLQVLIDGVWFDADATEPGPLGYSPPGAVAYLFED